jgi:hypothetical protein
VMVDAQSTDPTTCAYGKSFVLACSLAVAGIVGKPGGSGVLTELQSIMSK